MGDVGAAMERADRGEIERSNVSTGRVDVVPTEAVPQDAAELARESRARRTELAGRVLTLLSSLGNLALRIIEQRVSAAEVPTAQVSSGSGVASPSGSQRRKMTVGEGLGSQSGRGGRRRRRRQRGDS